ncbi:MAG: DUF378 domain-containing protein [Methanosarcina sp.]
MHEYNSKLPYNSKLRGVSKVLVLIGALNWGFVGLLDFNLVSTLFGKKSIISKLVYTLVGLAGVYLILTAKAHHKMAKLTCWR